MKLRTVELLDPLADTLRARHPRLSVTSEVSELGAHRRRGPHSVGVGYVVQGVLSHTRTPVAVVPIG